MLQTKRELANDEVRSAPDGQLLINKGDTWAFYALDSHKKAFTYSKQSWNVVSFVRLSVMVP